MYSGLEAVLIALEDIENSSRSPQQISFIQIRIIKNYLHSPNLHRTPSKINIKIFKEIFWNQRGNYFSECNSYVPPLSLEHRYQIKEDFILKIINYMFFWIREFLNNEEYNEEYNEGNTDLLRKYPPFFTFRVNKDILPDLRRQHLEIKIREGRFFNLENQLFNKDSEEEKERRPSELGFLFVFTMSHKIYCHKILDRYHHSNLSLGFPVLFAGYLFIRGGLLISFSDDSGHYRPDLKNAKSFLCFLMSQNVSLNEVSYYNLNFGRLIQAKLYFEKQEIKFWDEFGEYYSTFLFVLETFEFPKARDQMEGIRAFVDSIPREFRRQIILKAYEERSAIPLISNVKKFIIEFPDYYPEINFDGAAFEE